MQASLSGGRYYATGTPIVNIGKVMDVETRYRTPFGQRLLLSRKARKLTQEQVCAKIGISQSTLAELEREAASSGYTPMLAALYGVDSHWLATGTENHLAQDWQAHPVSLTAFDDPPTLSWEDLVNTSASLPATFVCAVPDEALAPLTPKGTRLIFNTTLKPTPGVGVLVEDRNGNRYIRRFVRGAGDRWLAAINNPAYAPLNSVEDGLRVLAVASGRLDGSV